jgi:hypothetical protein
MAYLPAKGGDDEQSERMAEMMGPGQVDHQIRQALQFCWMSLPKGRRTLDELEAQARRIFDRALRDFREDGEAFRK